MTQHKKNDGFTLAELMIVTAILAVVIAGILQLYIYSSVAAQLAGSKTLALSEAQGKLEEIRSYDFDNIYVDFIYGGTPGNTFSLSQMNGMGVIHINQVYTDELFEIEVNVSWEDKYNRIIGEDTDLDGVLDLGEDSNGNSKLDSIISVMTMITRR